MLDDAWCVDTDRRFEEATTYIGVLVEPGDPAMGGLIEHAENLDLVVYILNQRYAGKASPNGLGTYTYGDVQRAIWTLVEETLSISGLGAYSQSRVVEILALAMEFGEGFVPLCGPDANR